MKALKIIGLSVLVIIIAAGIATGGYLFAQSQHSSNQANNTNNSSNNNSNNGGQDVPVKPTKVTTCNADELSLTTAPSGDGGAGTLVIDIVLTNIGTRECIQGGFPGVSLVNENGNQIGEPASRATNYAEKTFTLKPGDKVYAEVSYAEEGDFDPGKCVDGATKLRVYAPNDTGYISVAQTAITAWCPGFETSPVLQ